MQQFPQSQYWAGFVTNEAFFMLISKEWVVSINLPNGNLWRARITKRSGLTAGTARKVQKVFLVLIARAFIEVIAYQSCIKNLDLKVCA